MKKGFIHSEETKRKMSLSHKGLNTWMKGRPAWNKGGTSWSKGRHLSEEHKIRIGQSNKKAYRSLALRKSISERMAGENNRWWKGGVNEKNRRNKMRIMNSFEYREWRRHVFQRDDYTCQACGERGGELHADHDLPFSDFPDVRLEVLNGRTLCAPCHRKTPTWGFKVHSYLKTINAIS